MSANLLEAKAMGIRFGGLKAVDNVSLTIRSGELIGLIGPNGAGKTTCFNLLTGVYQPTSGDVIFKGQSLKGKKSFQISHMGMTRTFQNIRLFKEMSVLENVLLATHQHADYGLMSAITRTPSFYMEEARLRDEAMSLLAIFGLDRKCDYVSSQLPYGEQRKLEIVRALATKPSMILLDEPAAGMNHAETESLMHTIAQIRKDFKLTVLLIEHDMKLVMGICERIYVLDHGLLIAEGAPESIQKNQKVIEAYLGVEEVPGNL
jgi:branched-chain amino acid transport system ATP-binding protein